MKKIFIIAEAGVNHDGDLIVAKQLVDAAAKSGADAVKFQTFKAEQLVVPDAPKVTYQKKSGRGGQFEMLKRLEFSYSDFKRLAAYCKARRIMFLSTPFDIESLHQLNRMRMPIIKIPSGEITNAPLLQAAGRLRKKIILSTGMSTLNEVEAAIRVLTAAGTSRDSITVLHCHSEYPTRFKDVNLQAMKTMHDKLGVKVGYSDHTLGIEAAIAAAAMGACIIEKHFTMDRSMPGPDHQASLEPEELKAMVSAVRHVQEALGDGIKRPTAVELKNLGAIRRSIVAKRAIVKGELFSEDNLAVKRPARGLTPMRWHEVIGQKAKRNFKENEMVAL